MDYDTHGAYQYLLQAEYHERIAAKKRRIGFSQAFKSYPLKDKLSILQQYKHHIAMAHKYRDMSSSRLMVQGKH